MLRLRQLLPKATNQGSLVTADSEPMPLAVLEFQSPTAAVIAQPLPPMARSTVYVVSAMFATLMVISCVMGLDRYVSSTGVMNSADPDFTIQAFNSSSILRNIQVHPGQILHRGDVVATLDPTYATADLTALTQQEQNYAAQVAQLQAQENGTPYVPDPSNPYAALQLQTNSQQMGQYNFTMQNYQQQINQLQTEINGYNQQAADFRQHIVIAQRELAMYQKLNELQVGNMVDLNSAQDNLVTQQASLSSALSSAQADERQLASVQAQMNSFAQQFKAQSSTQLATALNNLSQAQQALSKAQLENQQVALTAPQDAVVESVAPVAIGAVLQPGQTIATLSPIDAPFTIEAEIDASESGFVHAGDKVNVAFQTMPQFAHGSATGTVVSISAGSFNPNDQASVQANGAPLPGTPQDLYYKAEISLDELNLFNMPPGFQLMPGMPVSANIVVGRQTIMEYFVSHLSPIVTNALHEP